MTNDTDVMNAGFIISIIDDEESVRSALTDQFEAYGCAARAYASAPEFLASEDVSSPGCILLDVKMPGMTGLDLQEALSSSPHRKPIIFMTGNGSIVSSVQAMKAGAIDYLVKPIAFDSMMAAVDRAIIRDREEREAAELRRTVLTYAQKLTPRETEVMEFVAAGLMNKQIAFEMGISEIMVKLHRGRMMKKMQSRSVPDIVRKFDICQAALLRESQVTQSCRCDMDHSALMQN